MSLSAAVLFDRALKQTRRAALREQGLVPRPLPQIRVVRWLRAPRETFAAWSLMLLENVRTLDEAVDEVREDRRQKLHNRQIRREQDKLKRAQLKAISRASPAASSRAVAVAAVVAAGRHAARDERRWWRWRLGPRYIGPRATARRRFPSLPHARPAQK